MTVTISSTSGRALVSLSLVLPQDAQPHLRRTGVQQPRPRRHRGPARAAELITAAAKRASSVVEANRALDHRQVAGVLEDLELRVRESAGASQLESASGTSMSSRPWTISVGRVDRRQLAAHVVADHRPHRGRSPGAPRPPTSSHSMSVVDQRRVAHERREREVAGAAAAE